MQKAMYKTCAFQHKKLFKCTGTLLATKTALASARDKTAVKYLKLHTDIFVAPFYVAQRKTANADFGDMPNLF